MDLSAILRAKYGRDYVPDPKMMNLALQNGPLPQGFLTGEQEAAAFKNKDFIRMHASTLAKVDFFRHVILLAQQGRLRTATSSWGVRVDRLLEGRTAKVFALGAGVVGALVAIYQAWLWLKGSGRSFAALNAPVPMHLAVKTLRLVTGGYGWSPAYSTPSAFSAAAAAHAPLRTFAPARALG